MDWDHLRVFLAVARQGQLLGAARRLGLNHATVARKLDALESALGTPLYERRPAGCIPTQAAEKLLPVAERIEFEILGISETLRMAESDVSGTVRIGAPDGLGNYFLAGELATLARRHPNLTIELVPLPRKFSLSRREADIAISLDQPSEGRLVISRLIDYTLGVFASSEYLEREGTPQTVDDLRSHTVISGVEDFAYAAALDYLTVLEQKARTIFRCASVVGQTEAVASGSGVGILHDFVAVTNPKLIRIMNDVSFRRSYFLLTHPDSSSVRRISIAREFLVQRFRQERRRFSADLVKA